MGNKSFHKRKRIFKIEIVEKTKFHIKCDFFSAKLRVLTNFRLRRRIFVLAKCDLAFLFTLKRHASSPSINLSLSFSISLFLSLFYSSSSSPSHPSARGSISHTSRARNFSPPGKLTALVFKKPSRGSASFFGSALTAATNW